MSILGGILLPGASGTGGLVCIPPLVGVDVVQTCQIIQLPKMNLPEPNSNVGPDGAEYTWYGLQGAGPFCFE